MKNAKQSGAVIGTSLLSAIAASLCCITPVIALLAGSSSIAANFSWLEPARPYLISLSIVVLAFAWYRQLKPTKTTAIDCKCETKEKPTFFQSRRFLGIVTIFAALMMTFPLYAEVFYPKPKGQAIAAIAVETQQAKFTIQGMTCKSCEDHVSHELSKVTGVMNHVTSYAAKSSVVTFDPSKVDLKVIAAAISKTGYKVENYELMDATSTAVSFYEAPLVCHAAPSIGCGSKAKFLLVDLEKNKETVESAWLNRKGTVVAVKWTTPTDEKQKAALIKKISSHHNIELTPLTAEKSAEYVSAFRDDRGNWFKGKEVDKLSKEEAVIIAKNTMEGYKNDGIVKAAFEKQFQADIEKIYTDLFLSISSYQDLTADAYNKIEKQIQNAGEKYVGKGKMPKVELCVAGESCEKDQSCSKEGKSCCEKK